MLRNFVKVLPTTFKRRCFGRRCDIQCCINVLTSMIRLAKKQYLRRDCIVW